MDRRCATVLLLVGASTVAVGSSTGAPLSAGTAKGAQNGSPVATIAGIPVSRLKADAQIALELQPGAAASADALWTMQRAEGAIVRIDTDSNLPASPIEVGAAPCGSLMFGGAESRTPSANTSPAGPSHLWVPLCDSGTLAQVNVVHGNVTASMPLRVASPRGTLAPSARSLWAVTDAKGVVTRIDPEMRRPVAEVYVAARPFAIAATDDGLWVTSEEGNTLTRINPHTNVIVETITVGPQPGPLVVGEGAVWVLNRGDGSVSRVDSKTNKVVQTIALGEALPLGTVAVGEGAVWVSAPSLPLVRIDPRTNRVTHRFTGDGGGAVVVAHGSVWVNVGPKLTWRLDPRLLAAMRP